VRLSRMAETDGPYEGIRRNTDYLQAETRPSIQHTHGRNWKLRARPTATHGGRFLEKPQRVDVSVKRLRFGGPGRVPNDTPNHLRAQWIRRCQRYLEHLNCLPLKGLGLSDKCSQRNV
jgi:hypothetical protein